MSGIFGKVGPTDPDPGELVRMSAALAHRGPDDDGLRTGNGIGLGCRLLRTSGAGEPRQPVSDAAGSLWAVLDGAIYNAATLRKGLEERRGVSRGEGDAGLLVGLYTEYGTDFVGRLRGQFAFAIWDGGTRRLLLARDQLGQKPLFYAELPSGFYFASEIKALLPVLPSRPELDLEALDMGDSSVGWRSWLTPALPWFVAALGLVLIVGGGVWYWQSGKRKAERKEPRRRRKPSTAAEGAAVPAPPAGQPIYCHSCGNRASQGDRFCRICGTALRGN